MADPILIDSNTIIKLLIRKGSDADRRNIVLAEGELGFTVDTLRLYIGDGVTLGGISCSNQFLGFTTNLVSLAPATINDTAYKTDTQELYILRYNDGSDLGDWALLAGPTTINVDDQTIQSATDGTLSVKAISGGNIHSSAFGRNIVNLSNAIALSSKIAVDSINTPIITNTQTSFLDITNKLKFKDSSGNSLSFSFPTNQTLYDRYHLVTDSSGNLSFEPITRVQSGMLYVDNNILPVGAIIPYVYKSSIEPDGWLFCDGRSVSGSAYPELSAAIGTMYGGNSNMFNLPNLMPGGIIHGVDTTAETLSSTRYRVLTGTDTLTLSAIYTNSSTMMLSSRPVYYIVKYRTEAVVERTEIEVLSTAGLSAYNMSLSASTNTIDITGSYAIGVPRGDVGTGNSSVVEAYNRARINNFYKYTNAGIHSYLVPDHVYRIKVTATGGGGHGYVKYSSSIWRADATQGGAGGSVIAYVNVLPGQTYRIVVGNRGTFTTASTLESVVSALGWGGTTTFGLVDGMTTYVDLCATGAYDGFLVDGINNTVDWPGGGQARGGFKGGIGAAPNASGTVANSLIIPGGNGGFFFEAGPEGAGGGSIWGTGPAYGGGAAGHGNKSRTAISVASAGMGILTIEEL
jgi:microcystin-dependent protein